MRNITVGLLLVLLIGTAITIGNINENRNLQLQLDQQKEIIEQDFITEDVLRKEIDKLRQIKSTQQEEIEKKNKQLESLHKEIEKFKKEKSPSVSVMPSRGETKKYRTVNVMATAYIAFCDTGCIGITATGVDVRNTTKHDGYKVIAVDPNVIPLYSVVKVQTRSEQFLAMALDKGGDIKGNRIDVLVGSESKAFEFGRQPATITILREGKDG